MAKAAEASPFAEVREGSRITVEGRVYQKEIKSNYQILYVKQVDITNHTNIHSKMILYDYQFQKINIGNQIFAQGKLLFFDVSRNPGNFDQQFYNEKKGIGAALNVEQLKITDKRENWLLENLYQFKMKWHSILIRGAGETAGGILGAMLLGETADMDAELKELYQKCGIGHILAISGLHISFIGMGLFYLLRKAGVPVWISGGIGIFTLWLYLTMIGCPISALRAFIMYIFRVGAWISGRKYDPETALSFSAAVTIAGSPLYLKDAGFLLSYGAILGIIRILPLLQELSPASFKWLDGFLTSIAVNVILFPFLLYFYSEFPVYSIILNLAVVPLMSVIMASALLGSAIWCLNSAAGGVILWICRLIFQMFEWLCTIFMDLPLSRIVFGQPPVWRIFLYYSLLFGVIGALHYKIRCKKQAGKRKVNFNRERLIGIVSLILLLILISVRFHQSDILEVTVVDVGQGDGIFIRSPAGKTYFIDGGSSDVGQVGKYRIEPFLKSQGVGSLDYVFISHADTDHTSGIEEMLLRQKLGIRIRNLVLPPVEMEDDSLKRLARLAGEHKTKVYEMKAGDTVRENEFKISCLQPSPLFDGELNNASSMVLSLKYKSFDMLFTGDVEGEGEQMLKTNLQGKSFDVLKIAHHGSKNSSDEEFLNVVRPSYALISAGVNNRYGHPHKETVERLVNLKSVIYNTAESGAVTMRTDGGMLEIDEWLKQ